MKADSFHRMQEIFLAARGLPQSQRLALLDRECAGDSQLRSMVEGMLADETGDGFLASPPMEGKCNVGDIAAMAREHVGDGMTAEPSDRRAPAVSGFVFEKILGEGGMGIVWLAHQESPARRVAVKFVRSPDLLSPRLRARFRREIDLAAKLEHPNIARLYASGVDDPIPYCVMQYVDGRPLDDYAEAAKLATPDRLKLMQVLCSAVAYAHRHGVIHRDLKPSNVLVTSDGQPFVLDFGLAKPVMSETHAVTELTAPGAISGTIAYMSPEQAAGLTEKIDARSDLYTLGVILYRLLTGHSPHDLNGSWLEVVRRIAEDEVIRPHRANPGFDRDLEALLLKALTRRREERYQTAEEMVEAIDGVLFKLTRNQGLAPRKSRSRRVVVVSTLLVATALVVGIVLKGRPNRQIGRENASLRETSGANVGLADQHLVWIGEKDQMRAGFDAAGPTLSRDRQEVFVAGSAPRLATWRLARLYFCKNDLTSKPGSHFANIRRVNRWTPARNDFVYTAVADPAASNQSVLCLRPQQRLPDGVYCIYAGSLSEPNVLPEFAATFVVGGLSKPRLAATDVKVQRRSVALSIDVTNDGDGEFNGGAMVLTLQADIGKYGKFMERWEERHLQAIAPHSTLHYTRTFDAAQWAAGAYFFHGHMGDECAFDDEDIFFTIDTGKFEIAEIPK